MLNQAFDWLLSADLGQTLREKGIEVKAEIRTWPPDNAALIADFDSQHAVGRITCWNFGACDIEVLRRTDGETTHYRRLDKTSLTDLNLQIVPFLDAMVAQD
jgi:hypothetical protein